jgi:hypothetical protein
MTLLSIQISLQYSFSILTTCSSAFVHTSFVIVLKAAYVSSLASFNRKVVLHGHEVLRTPVRHCELNPIELIWAQVKGFEAKHNTTFRLKDVKELTYGKLAILSILQTTGIFFCFILSYATFLTPVAEKGMLCCVRQFWRTVFF